MRFTIVPAIFAIALLAASCGSDDNKAAITTSVTPSTGATPTSDTPATDTPATDTPATDTPATGTPTTDSPASTVPAADVATLTSTTWVLSGFITVGGPDLVPSDAQPTLAFDGTSKALIDTGCNTGSADITLGTDGTITFGPVLLTKKACSDALNTLEQRIVNLLELPSYWSVYDGHLSIYPATVTDTGMLFDATASG